MSAPQRPPSREDYEIAVICALQVEADAVEALFDEDWEEHQKYSKARSDTNAYSMGRIDNTNVVLAFMPGMGKGSSVNVATNFRVSFPNIRLGLVVGICGGVPFEKDTRSEILLGDVVISTAVVQHDFGRQYSDKFVRKDTLQDNLGRPNIEIRSFLVKMGGKISHSRIEKNTSIYLTDLLKQEGFTTSNYPGVDKDILFETAYRHKHRNTTNCICATCENRGDEVCGIALASACATLGCNIDKQILRARLRESRSISRHESVAEVPKPLIHFGMVASGDSVVKSSYHRDEIASEEGVIAFEMEGAGVWESFPTIIIKGVSDYADSHKSYQWRDYSAASAAACMKALLNEWRDTDKTPQAGAGSTSHQWLSFIFSRVSTDTDVMLTAVDEGALGPVTEQTSEVGGVMRAESEICKKVDYAYTLLHRRDTKSIKEDLDIARQTLQSLTWFTNLDSDLRQRIYWGLMAIEKELSCCRNFAILEKIEHIKEAQRYMVEVDHIVSLSSNTSLRVQVTLEQHIINGRKAKLEFQQGTDMERVKMSKADAIDGINKALNELQRIDAVTFSEVSEAAIAWRNKISETPF